MKAVLINAHGSRDVLKYKEIKEPKCDPNKIKINIKASSISHLDIWVRAGIPGVKIPLPMILGSDGSGIVTEVGQNIKSINIGDKVIILDSPITTFAKFSISFWVKPQNFNETNASIISAGQAQAEHFGFPSSTS